jgi:hypothetical protein
VSVAFSFVSFLFSSLFSLSSFLFPLASPTWLRVDRCEMVTEGKEEVEQFCESYPLHPLFEEANGKKRFVYRDLFIRSPFSHQVALSLFFLPFARVNFVGELCWAAIQSFQVVPDQI